MKKKHINEINYIRFSVDRDDESCLFVENIIFRTNKWINKNVLWKLKRARKKIYKIIIIHMNSTSEEKKESRKSEITIQSAKPLVWAIEQTNGAIAQKQQPFEPMKLNACDFNCIQHSHTIIIIIKRQLREWDNDEN